MGLVQAASLTRWLHAFLANQIGNRSDPIPSHLLAQKFRLSIPPAPMGVGMDGLMDLDLKLGEELGRGGFATVFQCATVAFVFSSFVLTKVRINSA